MAWYGFSSFLPRARARVVGVVALGVVLPATALPAQAVRRFPLITTLPASPRFAALGGAAVAVNGNAASVFSNPGALATIRHLALEGAFQEYPDGSWEAMAAGAFRVYRFNLGSGYHYLRLNDGSDIKDNLAWSGSLVYRRGILAPGITARYISVEDTAGVIARSGTTDIGLTVAVFDIMALAFAVQNVGNWGISRGGLDLPLTKRFGFSFNFLDPQGTPRLMGTLETVWANGQARRTVLGAEAGVALHGIGLVARIGSGAQPRGSGKRQTSYGAGIVLGHAGIDYAYEPRVTLGRGVHRVGFHWTL